jgi:hypothetical protein
MSAAFGSIMGAANQLMGQGMPSLGQIGGLGALALGGAVLQGLGVSPDQISGLIGSVSQLGQVGQMLINAASSGNLGALVGALSPENLTAMGGALQNLASLIPNVGLDLLGPLNQVFSQLQSVAGLIPNLAGLVQNLPQVALGSLLGSVTQNLGSLGGVLGKIGSMVSGEQAVLASAVAALSALAAAVNVPALAADACAGPVLAAVATPMLANVLRGVLGGGSGGSGGLDGPWGPPPGGQAQQSGDAVPRSSIGGSTSRPPANVSGTTHATGGTSTGGSTVSGTPDEPNPTTLPRPKPV